MIRSRFSLIGVLTIVIAGVVLAVHAQDTTQDTLTPEDCTLTTCFMGLRPGESTVQQVMNTIGSSAWVSDWSWYENSPGSGGFGWKWSDKAPSILTQVEYPGGDIAFSKGIVTDIQVKAAISPDFLVLLAGQPERYGMMETIGGWDMPLGLGLTFVTPETDFWFTSVIYCPFYPHVWENGDVSFIHWGNVDDAYPQGWNGMTADEYLKELKSQQLSCG